jgi:hypothetical protein
MATAPMTISASPARPKSELSAPVRGSTLGVEDVDPLVLGAPVVALPEPVEVVAEPDEVVEPEPLGDPVDVVEPEPLGDPVDVVEPEPLGDPVDVVEPEPLGEPDADESLGEPDADESLGEPDADVVLGFDVVEVADPDADVEDAEPEAEESLGEPEAELFPGDGGTDAGFVDFDHVGEGVVHGWEGPVCGPPLESCGDGAWLDGCGLALWCPELFAVLLTAGPSTPTGLPPLPRWPLGVVAVT